MTSTALQNIFAKHIHSHDHVRNLLFSRLGSENVWKLKKLLAKILEPGSEQESGSEQGSETEQGSGLETEPQSESGLWPSPIKEEGGDVDPGQKEEIIPAALVSVSLSSSERKEGFILPIVETSSLTLKSEKSDASNNTTGIKHLKTRKVVKAERKMKKKKKEKEEPQMDCDCEDGNFGDKKSKLFHFSTVHSNMDGCQMCKRAFSSNDNFKQHMNSHHGRTCGCPNILEMSEKEVLFHNQTVHRNHFGCNICFRTFKNKEHGLTHMAEHEGKRGFQCEKCGNDYKRAGDLKGHKKLCSDVDPVKCDLCDKCFNGKERLKIHRRRFHVGLHQCPECPKQVSRATLFTSHRKLIFSHR